MEAMVLGFFDEADHHGQVPRRVQDRTDFFAIRRPGQVGHHIPDEIACQRQLRKKDRVGSRLARLRNPLEVQLEVAVDVPEHGARSAPWLFSPVASVVHFFP